MICILLQHYLIMYLVKFTNRTWHFCKSFLLPVCWTLDYIIRYVVIIFAYSAYTWSIWDYTMCCTSSLIGINQWWAFTAPVYLKLLAVAAGNTYIEDSQYWVICNKHMDCGWKKIAVAAVNTYGCSDQFQ